MSNETKQRLIKVIESKDLETIELLAKVSLIFKKDELSKIVTMLSDPDTKKLVLSYLS